MLTENCPRCGCYIVNDLFEDEMVYWCPACGNDVTNEVLNDMQEEERLIEYAKQETK